VLVGGPPCAGKTTVSRILARRLGLRLYSADTQTWAHRDRALAAGNAAARRWESLDPALRWEGLTPNEMVDMSLHRERGPMVLDDLRALPASPLVIAEGSVVPAWAVSAEVVAPGRAVWLLPTPEFHARHLAGRGSTGGTERLYSLLRELIDHEAREHGVPTVIVDGSLSVGGVARQVETRLSEALAAGPRADTTGERRLLLREINMAVVVQIRAYYSRPWSDGDPETVERLFVCECGAPTCEDDLLSTVGSVAGAPALSPRHHTT
jgi:hypothetical protein